MNMQQTRTLHELVEKHPFEDYQTWWTLGSEWSEFMSDAIVPEWRKLAAAGNDHLDEIEVNVTDYLKTVYGQDKRSDLVDEFVDKSFTAPLQSGEFDALSYAFYKSAFTYIDQDTDGNPDLLHQQRKQFTRETGRSFFKKLDAHLDIPVPDQLHNSGDLIEIKKYLQAIGDFLRRQGYLKDHYAFDFNVAVEHNGKTIRQSEENFIDDLDNNGIAYALYEMGYPAILPSAVYLYHGIGEAQHHSSRIIEDFFSLVGCEARETDDFDPVGYPPDRVVELWEIKRR